MDEGQILSNTCDHCFTVKENGRTPKHSSLVKDEEFLVDKNPTLLRCKFCKIYHYCNQVGDSLIPCFFLLKSLRIAIRQRGRDIISMNAWFLPNIRSLAHGTPFEANRATILNSTSSNS
jgi:hypothetical protein